MAEARPVETARDLISIVTSACNAEKYIPTALASVRSQSYEEWELIVIDDGGTDATAELVTRFAGTVSQPVKILRNQQPQGPSAARNKGMKAAEGAFIAFLDADDFWLPQHLERLWSILHSGAADLAYSDAYVFTETPAGENKLLEIDTIEVTDPRKDLFRRNFINTSAAAITRRLMEGVGEFDPTLWAGEDLDYWIRAAILNFQIASTGCRTYYYRKSGNSLSTFRGRMVEGCARIYEKHKTCGILPESELLAKARESYFAAGKLYLRTDPCAARRAFFRAWKLSKRHCLPIACSLIASLLATVSTRDC